MEARQAGPEAAGPQAAVAAASHFDLAGRPLHAQPHPGGHIHESFALSCDGTSQRYLVQRVNTGIFTDPAGLEHNLEVVTARLASAGGDGSRGRLRALALVRTLEGRPTWTDELGRLWRVFPLLSDSCSTETVEGPAAAREVGRAYGMFHRQMLGLDPQSLVPVLPELHDLNVHLANLDRAVGLDPVGRVADSIPEIEALHARTALATEAEELSRACEHRVVHGDAKIANVVFDSDDGHAVCVVDLDTVRRAPVHTDFGDMVRSGASALPEDTTELDALQADPSLIEALAEGYLDEAAEFLTDAERESLVPAGRIVTFGQAVRFLADHLSGDRYFRVHRPGHNLDRCRVQIRLLCSLEDMDGVIARSVASAGAGGHR